MNELILKLYVNALTAKNALVSEEAQDLIEYALLVALIAFGAAAGMQSVASGINNAFSKIASKLSSSVT